MRKITKKIERVRGDVVLVGLYDGEVLGEGVVEADLVDVEVDNGRMGLGADRERHHVDHRLARRHFPAQNAIYRLNQRQIET